MMNPLEGFVNRILHGDCLEVLKTLPSHSVDAIVTDPPYGIGTKEPTVEEIIAYLRGDKLDTGGDFMNAEWEIPSVAVWKECLRVLKPGGYVLSFSSTRTWDIMSLGIRAAGFEDRDTIASLFGPSALFWVHCLTEDTEALTEHGWKKYSDIRVGDAVACWNPSTEEVTLGDVQNIYQSDWDGPMAVLRNDDVDCVVTPNHRVFYKSYERKQVQGIRKGSYSDWTCKEASEIPRTCKIKLPMSGYCHGLGVGGLDYARLAAWVWTEGSFDASGNGVRIYQSESANPDNVRVIDDLMTRLGVAFSRYDRERVWSYKGASRPYTEICWYFADDLASRIRSDLPDKVPSWSFIWSMTLEERKAFYEVCIDGDGNREAYQFYQKGEEALSVFQGFLTTMGYTGKIHMRPDRPGHGHVNIRTKPSTELTIKNLQAVDKEPYKGKVWCLEVPTGAFIVRRNHRVFVTGNSQGFPKSLNISKAIEKIEGLDKAAELAKLWKGWGTALKPAWEPILCYRSPVERTVAEQVATTGTGAINIDGARIRHSSPEDLKAHQDMVAALKAKGGKLGNSWKNSSDLSGANEVSAAGRWPSHVLLTHAPGCRQVGTRKVDAPVINRFDDGMKPFGHGAGHSYTSTPTGDADGKEEIPVYECVSNCPVRVLNASNEEVHGDISRVFAQFVPDAPFFYSPKASRKERNEFLDVRKAPKPKDGVRIMYFRLKEEVDEDIFLRIQEAVNDQTEADARDLNVSVEKVTPVDVESFAFEKHLFEHLIPKELREHFEVDDTVGGNTHPCLHPDSLVLTDQGYQPIKHVRVGHRVLSADGNLHNVEAVTRHTYTSPDLFEIAVSGNDQTSLVSDNHPYLIFRLEGENPLVQWVEAKDIRIGDYTMTPKSSLPVISDGLPVVEDVPSVGLLGTHFSISFVRSVKKIPYRGDVMNLSVEGNPTFQTSVGMSHNTVKPRALMEYLVRLVTPKGGVVLDPYCGSGTTLLSAMQEGMQFIGIERDPGFFDIAHRRAAKRLETRVSEEGAEVLHNLMDDLPQE